MLLATMPISGDNLLLLSQLLGYFFVLRIFYVFVYINIAVVMIFLVTSIPHFMTVGVEIFRKGRLQNFTIKTEGCCSKK